MSNARLLASSLSLLSLFCACHSQGLAPAEGAAGRVSGADSPVPGADESPVSRPLRSVSAEAQRAFDRGLYLMWAFNHDGAIAAFEEAARQAPHSPMPWWGVAFAHGPHINNPALDPARGEAAWKALQEARARLGAAEPVERDLIEALAARYSADFSAPRAPLDQAFADAMRRVQRQYPADADVMAWCAEALMDVHPWDLWTQEQAARDWTPGIVELLEHGLAQAPDHPGLCHLYIHAMEAGPLPGRAAAAAERLANHRGDAGHLIHMPAHIHARLGRWAEAAEANRRAVAADTAQAARFPRDGFYRLYMAHNHHFLAWACMMLGDRGGAQAAARAMVGGVPQEFIQQMAPTVDGYLPVDLHVEVRFGQWSEILARPAYPPELKICNAVRHYARGVALTALDRLDEAERELVEFDVVVAGIEESRPIGNNPARTVLQIPRNLLGGELEFRRGEVEIGLDLLREAVRLQSLLVYDEAPDWMMPARHTLGAALLVARRFEEAEEVFRADLAQYPENGWSLFGLRRALEGRGATAAAAELTPRFEKSWSHADVQLTSPCFCQAGR
jgi:tetratricopeptide (TPR) repeat protein